MSAGDAASRAWLRREWTLTLAAAALGLVLISWQALLLTESPAAAAADLAALITDDRVLTDERVLTDDRGPASAAEVAAAARAVAHDRRWTLDVQLISPQEVQLTVTRRVLWVGRNSDCRVVATAAGWAPDDCKDS